MQALLDYWASRYGINVHLVRALAYHESGYQPTAVSPAGARGVMQVLPAHLAVRGDRAPRHARPAHRERQHSRRSRVSSTSCCTSSTSTRARALAAYHQGPAAVRRYGLFPVTRHFVRSVLALRAAHLGPVPHAGDHGGRIAVPILDVGIPFLVGGLGFFAVTILLAVQPLVT